MAVIGEIRGKDALLVDDLTETAGTLTKAAELLKHKGARKILACVSHAILNDMGIERLRKSPIDELITTDTVLRPAIDGVKIITLSVAGFWAKPSSESIAIRRLLRCLSLKAGARVSAGAKKY